MSVWSATGHVVQTNSSGVLSIRVVSGQPEIMKCLWMEQAGGGGGLIDELIMIMQENDVTSFFS